MTQKKPPLPPASAQRVDRDDDWGTLDPSPGWDDGPLGSPTAMRAGARAPAKPPPPPVEELPLDEVAFAAASPEPATRLPPVEELPLDEVEFAADDELPDAAAAADAAAADDAGPARPHRFPSADRVLEALGGYENDGELAVLPDMPMPAKRAAPVDQSPFAHAIRSTFLGELLMEAGFLKADQVEMALNEQRRTKNLLGEVLVSLGFVTEAVVAEAVGHQTGIPFVQISKELLPTNLLKLVPEELCRTHMLVPVSIEGSELRLAMANPFDVVAIDNLREATGMTPVPHIAAQGQILACIERSFTQRASFDETFERLIVSAEARVGHDEKEALARGPLVELVDQLIVHAVEERATDIHIEPEELVVRVRYRVDSILQPGPMVPKKLQSAVVARLKVLANLNISESRLPQDGRIRFDIKGRQIDLRISTFLCNFGENVVLRVLDKSSVVLSFEKLGFLDDDRQAVERIIEKPHGIILVTGPTGSGKTTTLYTALSKLNTIDVNIMTIEDPIEYELNLVRQSQVNVKAGITFATGMRALLRQDPDIILIGEMRDEETAQMAVRAAMTGHLVFSTLHTNTAVGAIARLVDMKLEPLMLTDTIVAIIAQRLARKACEHCCVLEKCPDDRVQELEKAAARERITWDGRVPVAKGCPQCRQRGYQGRLGLFEIFEITPQAQELILERRWGTDLARYAAESGMRSMYDDGLRRLLRGHMTLEELDRSVGREIKDAVN